MIKRIIGIALPVALLDQGMKLFIRQRPLGQTLFEIPNLIAITPCMNTGAAFSLFSGRTALLVLGTSMLLLALCLYVAKAMHLTPIAQMAFGCVIGGGIGNWIDRMVYGSVTDYIRLLMIDFPIFNLADIAITGGVAILLILLMAGRIEDSAHGAED